MNAPQTTYIGTKVVLAVPMTLGEYNAYRGWAIPALENPESPGYLVEYVDGGAPNDDRHPGYISWSPAQVFEQAYRVVGATTFPANGAPRVTLAEVEAAIHKQDFTLLPDGRTTICTLTLDNGFTVRGESSCVCIENFDEMIGRKIASDNARGEVWKMLLGFRLAERLHANRMAAKAVDE